MDNQQPDPQMILQFMVTEHSALQSARSSTIFDSSGRTNMYLSAVSSTLVALAFIGQMSQMGDAFFIFALVLFPSLFFLGLATFVRVLETGIEDMVYAMGINRIRHYYLEIAPQMERYFTQSAHDDMLGMRQNMGFVSNRYQILLTTAGMVSVVNSVLMAVFVGMIAAFGLSLSPTVSIVVGIVVFFLSVVLHTRYQQGVWRESVAKLEPLFPTPKDQ